jgi:hypothetical protein
VADKDPLTLEQLQMAQIALAIADREVAHFGAEPCRSEVILRSAGLPIAAIAQLCGREFEAVKSTVRRGRQATRAGSATPTPSGTGAP